MYTRRGLLKGAAALAALGSGGGKFVPAYAKAPFQKFQAPGFYRMPPGRFEVTALLDGTLPLPLPELYSARVARSSGNSELDEAALDMLRRASPVPAPPPGVGRHCGAGAIQPAIGWKSRAPNACRRGGWGVLSACGACVSQTRERRAGQITQFPLQAFARSSRPLNTWSQNR
jgi:hypothetical protein